MASGGLIGNGSKVGYRIAGSPAAAWTTVGQILNDLPLGFVRDEVDKTTHSTGIFKRSLPGMAKYNNVPLELLRDPDPTSAIGIAQKALSTLALAGTTVQWRIEVPVDRAQTSFYGIDFNGYVGSVEDAAPIMGRQVRKCSIVFDDTTVTEDSTAAASLLA